MAAPERLIELVNLFRTKHDLYSRADYPSGSGCYSRIYLRRCNRTERIHLTNQWNNAERN